MTRDGAYDGQGEAERTEFVQARERKAEEGRNFCYATSGCLLRR